MQSNHGINETFSTGSQAQYPPHPRTSYDHAAPKLIPMVKKNQEILTISLDFTTQLSWFLFMKEPKVIANGNASPTYPK